MMVHASISARVRVQQTVLSRHLTIIYLKNIRLSYTVPIHRIVLKIFNLKLNLNNNVQRCSN